MRILNAYHSYYFYHMIDAPDIEELTQAPIQAPLDPDPGEFLRSGLI